jgi:hypothetical protein
MEKISMYTTTILPFLAMAHHIQYRNPAK